MNKHERYKENQLNETINDIKTKCFNLTEVSKN